MKKTPSFLNSNKLVIKVGSSLLIKNNKFNTAWLISLIEDLKYLKKNRVKFILVVSGAVSLGSKYLKIKKSKLALNQKQAFAACGQVILMRNFMMCFQKYNFNVAQILLTYSDTEDRKKSLNSKETINTLIESNVIPIINENDTVATEELKFGDNDRLAARVAQIFGAKNLILLSDVDGLYDKNPQKNKNARFIPFVNEISHDIQKMASNDTNSFGSGGMQTKIQASEIATSFGCNTLICSGIEKNPIKKYLKSKKGTWFISKKNTISSFKSWLAGTIKVLGSLTIDNGAYKALLNGASLLPSGIKKISGKFYRGDIIEIILLNGNKIGKGISYYDSEEIRKIKGKNSADISTILGYMGREEVIHRDNLNLNDA